MQVPKDELELELRDLTSRDFQLWCIALLLLVVVALGFLAIITPHLVWKNGPVELSGRYLPQLFSAFIVLIVLANAYLTQQRRRLNTMREGLVRRLLTASESPESGLVDPLTQAFNTRYIDHILPSEMSRVARSNSALTLLVVDLAGFKVLNSKFGTVAGDHALLVLAQTLRKTFRGSDTICRAGGDEFVVIMPDTTELQARTAVIRLTRNLDQWNKNTSLPYKLLVRCGMGQYNVGTNVHWALTAAAQMAGANIALTIERVRNIAAEFSERTGAYQASSDVIAVPESEDPVSVTPPYK